jgi:hypothetical protein
VCVAVVVAVVVVAAEGVGWVKRYQSANFFEEGERSVLFLVSVVIDSIASGHILPPSRRFRYLVLESKVLLATI